MSDLLATVDAGYAHFRVLVADDTMANRILVRAYLTRLGFPSVMVENGKEAVEVYERERPDIVLMDVMMPVMDGLEATREIRSRAGSRWIPIVMLSALGGESDVVSGLDIGADDYLIKPLSYQIFAAKMRSVARALQIQRKMEDALGHLRAVSAAMSDGLVTFDAQCCIRTANPALGTMFGRDPGAFIGEKLDALFTPPGGARLQADIAAWAGQDDATADIPRVRELEAIGAAARTIPVELALSGLMTESGQMFLAVIRDISERKRAERELARYTLELQRYHDEAEQENALALEVLERQVRRGGVDDPHLRHSVMPAKRFSGDLVLAARAPDGRLFALLADATGHGLGAAVSVLPAVGEFYRLVAESPSSAELVFALNEALSDSLPLGRFVAAALACIDCATGKAAVWVGGTPDVLRLDARGRLIERYPSNQLPLGIDPLPVGDVGVRELTLAPGEQLLLFSDGLPEACDPCGMPLGYEGMLAALDGRSCDQMLSALNEAVAAHCGHESPHDDVSMLLISA